MSAMEHLSSNINKKTVGIDFKELIVQTLVG